MNVQIDYKRSNEIKPDNLSYDKIMLLKNMDTNKTYPKGHIFTYAVCVKNFDDEHFLGFYLNCLNSVNDDIYYPYGARTTLRQLPKKDFVLSDEPIVVVLSNNDAKNRVM